MGSTKGDSKPKSKLKTLLVLPIIIIAALAGGYYYLSTSPKMQFTIAPSPPFFHVVPGSGAVITINVTRLPGFAGDVNVTIANAPSWVNYHPISIPASANSGNLTIIAAQNAPKGSTQLTISATAPNLSPQTSTVAMKVVGSYNVTSATGTADVYDTTKALDNATTRALLSYSNTTGTVTFSQSTSQLQGLEMGDVIVLSPKMSSTVPKGFARTVLNVQNSGGQVLVLTQQAHLLDMFLRLKVGTPRIGNSSIAVTEGFSVESISPGQSSFMVPCAGNVWTIAQGDIPSGGIHDQLESPQGQGNVHLDADLSYQFCLNAGYGVDWSVSHPIPTIHYFEVDAEGIGQATFDLTGTAGATLQWTKNLYTFAEDTYMIIPPILWVDLSGYLEGVANGQIGKNDIHLTASGQLGFVEGPEYCDYQPQCSAINGWTWDGQTFHNFGCNFCDMNYATVKNLAGSTLTFGIGPRLHGDIDSGLAGVDLAGHLDATFSVQVPHNPVWWIDGSLDATLSVEAFYGLASWSGTGNCCKFSIINGPDFPPEPPVITIPSSTLDFTKGFSNPADFQWSATVFEPEGDKVCSGQGSVTWYSGILQDGKQGQIGTGCAIDASKVAWSSSGKRLIWAIATDSAGLASNAAKSIAAAVTVTIILAKATVQIVTAPTGESRQPPNTLFLGKAYTFTASVYILYGSYQQPLDCSIVRWEITIPPGSPTTWGTGCTFTWIFKLPGVHLVTAVATYNGQDSSSAPLTYNIIAAPTGSTPAPTVQITSPAPNAQLSINSAAPVAGQASDSSEMITPSKMQWSASWTDANGQHTIPVKYVQGTLVAKFIQEIGGSGGTMYVTFNWDLNQWCTSAGPEGYSRGYVYLSLVAVDSKGQRSQPAIVQVDLSCAVFGSMPLMPSVALVTLLAVLFTVTTERKTTIVEIKPWLQTWAQGG